LFANFEDKLRSMRHNLVFIYYKVAYCARVVRADLIESHLHTRLACVPVRGLVAV